MLIGLATSDGEAQDQAKDAKGNVYFDDFDRNDLGDKYSIIDPDPDPDRLTLSNGKLVILGTNPRKNVVLLEERFSGDFVETIRVVMEVSKYNFEGLRHNADEENYLLVEICGGLSGTGSRTAIN